MLANKYTRCHPGKKLVAGHLIFLRIYTAYHYFSLATMS